MALCETGSGSGWWLFYVEQSETISGPYVPREGRGIRFYRMPLSGRLVTIVWRQEGLYVRTKYPDGKPYVFTITKNGSARIVKW